MRFRRARHSPSLSNRRKSSEILIGNGCFRSTFNSRDGNSHEADHAGRPTPPRTVAPEELFMAFRTRLPYCLTNYNLCHGYLRVYLSLSFVNLVFKIFSVSVLFVVRDRIMTR